MPNMVEKLFPDIFLKKILFQNWAYLWISSLNFFTVFLFYVQVEGYWNIRKLRWRPLAFASYKTFFKSTSFLHDFWRKVFLMLAEGVCITATGNILASGNLCFRLLKLQWKVINKNACYLCSLWVNQINESCTSIGYALFSSKLLVIC